MSTYLFAEPSFLSGAARVFDIGGVFDDYNTSDTPEQADLRAAVSDWQGVGRDLREAMQAERSALPAEASDSELSG